MALSCKDIWQEVSNYLDDDLEPELRELIELHLENCIHCATLVDSTRNVIILIADERTFTLPGGFSERLAKRLAAEIGNV